jgi:hypothetical protein
MRRRLCELDKQAQATRKFLDLGVVMRGNIFSLDHMAIGCVVIAGVVEAAQQALTGAPNVAHALPTFATSGNWNYVPLILLIIAGLAWVKKQLSRGGDAPRERSFSDQIPTETAPSLSHTSLQLSQPEEVTETFSIPSGADRDLQADYQFLQDLNSRWRLMADAYRDFIEGWNTYARDLVVCVGRPGLLNRPSTT